MDQLDWAQDISERERRLALERHLNRPVEAQASARICEECEEEIPEARRLAMPGCSLCVECQSEREELRRRGR